MVEGLIERMSKAAWEKNQTSSRLQLLGVELPEWGDPAETALWDDWRQMMRAALQAARDGVTERMTKAAWPKLAAPAECHYASMWRNMCDAELRDE